MLWTFVYLFLCEHAFSGINAVWYVLLFFFFWLRCATCGILVPQSGIEPVPPALGAWSLNHLTAREIPVLLPPPHLID